MFDHIQEEYSPYVAAKKENIAIDYYDLGNKIVGIYADLNGYQVVLNSRMDNDRQEDCLQMLVEHHLSHRGMERKILKNELIKYNNVVAEISRLNKIFVNALIMRRGLQAEDK